MNIAIAGSRGFIGKNFMLSFPGLNYILLNREDLYKNPEQLAKKISGCDAVINVAGYSISKRWTKKNKRKNYVSRVNVTRQLVEAINFCEKKPAAFISGSAIGIYEYNKEHNEKSKNEGSGFLANLVKEWEQATEFIHGETRIAKIRIGLVLGNNGGAFTKLYRLFKIGLGGRIASGKQVISFIHIKDLVDAMYFILDKKLGGTFNLTSPEPVTNKEFSSLLAKSLNRKAIIPVPEIILKIVLGESSELLTKGHMVLPERLLKEGYKFTFANAKDAIENLIAE